MPALALAVLLLADVAPPQHVSFATSDGGVVFADVWGRGDRGVVLAHGGRFDKESWAAQAKVLAEAGFRVLAFDFRGRGRSRGPGDGDLMSAPLHLDVLAAVRFLKKAGARTVSVVGGSMGAGAAGDAAIEAPGEIDRLVLLAGTPNGPAERLTGRKLFVVARDDVAGQDVPRLPRIRAAYGRAPQPKELLVLEGSAHAQFIFQTAQGERLMRAILDFLKAP
ncbi:MAG TPA: alpha/beta fold hydrolase [Vicinamibacteria bacterium]|nr:alpha/beta fold hydrolase [Vicinamibacteria bacterium]